MSKDEVNPASLLFRVTAFLKSLDDPGDDPRTEGPKAMFVLVAVIAIVLLAGVIVHLSASGKRQEQAAAQQQAAEVRDSSDLGSVSDVQAVPQAYGHNVETVVAAQGKRFMVVGVWPSVAGESALLKTYNDDHQELCDVPSSKCFVVVEQ